MSIYARAQIHQKRNALKRAIQEFKSGKNLVENELGSQHNLNEVFLQAINNLIVYMTP